MRGQNKVTTGDVWAKFCQGYDEAVATKVAENAIEAAAAKLAAAEKVLACTRERRAQIPAATAMICNRQRMVDEEQKLLALDYVSKITMQPVECDTETLDALCVEVQVHLPYTIEEYYDLGTFHIYLHPAYCHCKLYEDGAHLVYRNKQPLCGAGFCSFHTTRWLLDEIDDELWGYVQTGQFAGAVEHCVNRLRSYILENVPDYATYFMRECYDRSPGAIYHGTEDEVPPQL